MTNAGSGALNWAAGATTSNGGNWLTLSATQGAAPATITVSANPAGLPAGVYLGSIRFTDSATGASVPIVAALTINPPATTILLSQSDLVFTTTESSQTPLRQILRILNIGQGAAVEVAAHHPQRRPLAVPGPDQRLDNHRPLDRGPDRRAD